MGQGPGRIAKVTAKVTIGEPKATRQLGDTITFDIRIPLEIDLLVDLRLDKQRFNVDGEVALRATARAAEPLALVLEVAKPRPTNISVHVSTKSIRGEIVRIIGGVDAEIRRCEALAAGGRPAGAPAADAVDVGEPIRGAGVAIAANMERSLTVPTATSFRNVPAKLLTTGALFVSCILSWPIFINAYLNNEYSSNAGGLIVWPVRALVPIGFFLLILQGVSELIKRFAFLAGLISDPNAKPKAPSAEEELAKAIKQQRGEAV